MMFVSAIVVAAGKGLRLKSKIPKPLVRINSKPLIICSLEVLSKHPLIKEIVVAANLSNIDDIKREVKKYKINKVKGIAIGGIRRQDSVENGLKLVHSKSDFVLIHDAARPFINNTIVSSAIKKAKRYGASIVGVPVKNTIKEVYSSQFTVYKNPIVRRTIDRENLWEVQTPQVFKKKLFLEAYDKFKNIDVTDEAMLFEMMGVKVGVVFGSYDNIKITTPEDLIIAEAIARYKNKGS